MLDIKWIRENEAAFIKGLQDKHIRFDYEKLFTLHDNLAPLNQEVEALRSEKNIVSKEIPKASPEKRAELIKQMTALKSGLESKEQQLSQLQSEFDVLLMTAPQPARSDVPIGKDDADNLEVRKVGTVPEFDFEPLSHVELGEKHLGIDIPGGVKIAGSRSYILKGDIARLEQAVFRYTYDFLMEKGYMPYSIPTLVKFEAMEGTGYFPGGIDQAYICEKDNMSLIGTAEVSLAAYFSDKILQEDQFPIRVMAHSSCYRREAGTYGKDTSGLYRVHQFQKIEQVIIGPADDKVSESLHDQLLGNAESILKAFELPYRVVYVCTGDLGQGQLRKHDIETWMPSRQSYGETHSCSTFHQFQARRLKIRYKDANGKSVYCHTLNNTAIASPRILIALLENHQDKNGCIRIPKVLQPYMNGQTKISPPAES